MGEINQDFIDKDGFHHTELDFDDEKLCPKCLSDNLAFSDAFSNAMPNRVHCNECGLNFDVKEVAIWKEPSKPAEIAAAEPIISLSEVEEDSKL